MCKPPLKSRQRCLRLSCFLFQFSCWITSLVLEHQVGAMPVERRKLSARDKAILISLDDALEVHGVEPRAEIKAKFCGFDSLEDEVQKIVLIEHWRPMAYKSINVDSNTDDARRMALNRCRTRLLDQRLTAEYDGYIWRVFE